MNSAGTELREVADAIERLTMWLRRQAPAQVSSSTVAALDSLATHGPLRVSDLAAREALTQPGTTILINRLEAGGQAERVPDPTDGRATLVRITPVGHAVLAERHQARLAMLSAELDRLDHDDQRALAAALPALRHLISAPAPASASAQPGRGPGKETGR